MLEELGGLAEVVARLERARFAARTAHDCRNARRSTPTWARPDACVQPRHQTEREEVLRPLGVARLHAQLLGGLERHRRHADLDDAVRRERAVVERVGLVAGLLEVALLERVGVDEDRAAGRELGDVGPQRGGVHRHEHRRQVAGREDVVIGDVHLERRHPGDRAGRRADLGREVREGREVVAERGAHVGETVAGELHPVARVARKADDDLRGRDLGLREVSGVTWPRFLAAVRWVADRARGATGVGAVVHLTVRRGRSGDLAARRSQLLSCSPGSGPVPRRRPFR